MRGKIMKKLDRESRVKMWSEKLDWESEETKIEWEKLSEEVELEFGETKYIENVEWEAERENGAKNMEIEKVECESRMRKL